jgi:hypothetical protein
MKIEYHHGDEEGIAEELEKSQRPPAEPLRDKEGRLWIGSGEDAPCFN